MLFEKYLSNKNKEFTTLEKDNSIYTLFKKIESIPDILI